MKEQSAYRVVVASSADLLRETADLWDSGKVVSDQSVWIPYAGSPLNAQQQLCWQVQFWDETAQASAWSEVATVELGLLKNSDWQARWIGMAPQPTDESADARPHYVPLVMRREFEMDGPIRQARLHVTAKGLYEVHLNGGHVGTDSMTPGFTPYHARIETLTYDVTAQVREGRNAIGAVLGEGWYAGNLMCKKFVYPEAVPRLLLQLEVTYSDGRTNRVVSDEQWKATDRGPIRYSSIYHGETYDARLELQDWSRVGFDDTAWCGVEEEPVAVDVALTPKRHGAVRASGELAPVAVTQPIAGSFVFDLGQNIVGRARLCIPVEKDQTVTLRFAEMLQSDGTLYTENYRAAKSTDRYTAREDGTVTWSPTFTFHGFRYIELTGLPQGVEADPAWVTGVVLHSAFEPSGHFATSHPLLNRLQSNITWGQRGNFLDIPTDCPQRNERLGWTGDAQVFCPTSMFNYDVLAFWMSWLQSVREDQTEDGLIPHVVPEVGVGAGSPGWGDVAVTAPWDIYVRTGYRPVLIENFDMMKRWTAVYERAAVAFVADLEGFGDWLQPYSEPEGLKGQTPMKLISTACFGRCAAIMQRTCEVLGEVDDAARYEALFASIQEAFSAAFFDAEGNLVGVRATQTGYLMALDYNLLRPELRAGALRGLLRLLDDADGHLRTGFLGTPLIAPVLDRFGELDKAYGALLKDSYPSWFYSIHQGATTLWERWNSYSHADGFGDPGMNSFNHYAYGAIGQWMYERIAGLAPDPAHPGYKHFFVQPVPGGGLTSASADLQTPYGMARSAWEIADGALRLSVTVPPNTSATVRRPAGFTDGGAIPQQLTPGAHAFTLTLCETID